jgi:hypothetical protein
VVFGAIGRRWARVRLRLWLRARVRRLLFE